MELIEGKKQLPRRAVNIKSTGTLGVASSMAIDIALNRLDNTFSVASFILAEHEIHWLSHLCRMYAQLKLRVMNHFQQLNSNYMGIKKHVRGRQNKINIKLELEITVLESGLKHSKTSCLKN